MRQSSTKAFSLVFFKIDQGNAITTINCIATLRVTQNVAGEGKIVSRVIGMIQTSYYAMKNMSRVKVPYALHQPPLGSLALVLDGAKLLSYPELTGCPNG